MKKNLLLYILLIFLIIMNAFFLYNYLGQHKPDRGIGPQRPKDFIAKQLNFTERQITEFHELSESHHQRMRALSDELRELKDTFFNELSREPTSSKTVDSIASLIAGTAKKRDLEIFDHFKKIQEICDDKQKEEFNRIIKEAVHIGMGSGPRAQGNIDGRPPPKMKREEGQRPPPPHRD